MTYPVKKTLKGRRAVVLGNNVAGLSAAISLAVRGARVVVLHGAGGDTADSGFWPPTITSPQVFAELFASAEQRLNDFVDLERMDPLCRFHFQDQAPIDFHAEPSLFAAQIAKLDPRDATRIIPFLDRAARASAGLDRIGPILKPSSGRTRTILGGVAARASDRLGRTYLQSVVRTFGNASVRNAMLALGTLTGSPITGPAGPALARIGEFHQHGGWRIEGGNAALHRALVRLCEILRIRLVGGCKAEKIEIEKQRVRRVSGRGFKPLVASIVVATGGRDALPAMLDSEARKALFWHGPRPLPGGDSSISFRLKLQEPLAELAALNVFVGPNPLEEARQRERWWVPSAEPTIVAALLADGRTLQTFHRLPPLSERFVWTAGHLEEEEAATIKRIAACGFDKFGTLVEEARAFPPAVRVLRDARMPSRPERRHLLRREAIPQRSDVLAGLYFCGDTSAKFLNSPADASFKGMWAAELASEDA